MTSILIKKYMGVIDTDGALFFATGIDNTGFYKGKKEAIGMIKTMASEISSFDVFAGLGVSAGLAFGKAISASMDFENKFKKSMLTVATISEEVGKNFDQYSDSILDLTTKIPIEADKAGDALYQIISAGYDGADAMKILEVSSRNAIGGITETTTSADTITTILNSYRKGADEAEDVSDKLFTTVKLGKTTMTELGASMSNAAPVAASFGVEMDQMLAAVATLTSSGVPTAEAMTQIRGAIIAVTKVLGDGAFETRTFQEALKEVADMAGGSEEKLRKLIPDVRGLQAVLGLTGINAKKAASDLEKISTASGSANKAFNKMMEDQDNQLKLLGNNIMKILRPLGKTVVREVTKAAEAFNKAFISGDIQDAVKKLGELTIALGSVFVIYKATVGIQKARISLLKTFIALRKAEIIQERGIAAARQISIATEVAQIGKTKAMTIAIKKQTAAWIKNTAARSAALIANPVFLATTAIASFGYVIYKAATAQTALEKATKATNKVLEEQKARAEEIKNKTEEYLSVIRDESETDAARLNAFNALISIYPDLLAKIDLETLKTMDLVQAKRLLNEERDKQLKKEKKENIEDISRQIKYLEKQNKEAEKVKFSGVNINTVQAIDKQIADNESKIRQLKEELKIYEQQYINEANNAFAASLQAKYKEDFNKLGIDEKIAALAKQKENIEKKYNEQLGNITFKKKTGGLITEEEEAILDMYATDLKRVNTELEHYNAVKNEKKEKRKYLDPEDEKLINKAKQEREDTILKLTREVEDKRNEIEKRGSKDRLAIIDHEYKESINAIKRQKEDYIKSQIEKKIGQKKAEEDAQEIFKEAEEVALEDRNAKIEEYEKEVLNKYKNYADKRQDILEKFEKEKNILIKKGSEENIKILKEETDKKLAILDTEYQGTESVIARIFESTKNKAKREIDEVRELAKELFDFLKGGKWDPVKGRMFGINESQFRYLSQAENLKHLGDQVENLDDKAFNASSSFEKIGEGIKGLNKDNLKDSLSKISAGVGEATEQIQFFADALAEIGETFGAGDIFNDIAEGISIVADAASKTMQGAQIGGQFGSAGAIVGAAVGLASSVFGTINKIKKHNKEIEKQLQQSRDKEILGQYALNEEYRKRYEWAKKIGETELKYIARKGVELKKQRVDNEKEQNYLWNLLKKQQYKANEYTKRNFWGKKRIKIEWESLSNKSFKEIELLASQGKLSEEGQRFFEALKKSKEEGEDLLKKQEEFLQYNKELFTGTTQQSIVDSIVDGFLEGKRSAADFAKSFEDLMKKAIANALKIKLEDEVNDFYEEFYRRSEDGLNADDIEYLKKRWMELNERNLKRGEDFEKITGIKTSEDTRTASAKGIAQASQESIDILSGKTTTVIMLLNTVVENYKALYSLQEKGWKSVFNIEQLTDSIKSIVGDIDIKIGDVLRDGLFIKK